MDERDAIAGELPAPREDDPPGLRNDIVDELADHLACAYNRERLRGADATEARRRVFERFGDPAAVARRLWFDAVGGKIMAQRVVVAACFVVSLASLTLAGAMWVQSNRAHGEAARQTAEALRAVAVQNAQALAGQLELAKQLRAISDEIKTARTPDWNPVTFRLVEESANGPPAAGFSVTLNDTSTSGAGGESRPLVYTRVSDATGIVNLGFVRPGTHPFAITKAWDQGKVAISDSLVVEPGTSVKRTFLCPKVPPEVAPVRIRAHWPPDLEREGLVLYLAFRLERSLGWNVVNHRQNDNNWFVRSALSGPRAQVTELFGWQHYFWRAGLKTPVWADIPVSQLREIKVPDETLRWEEGTYRLTAVFVLRPHASSGGERLRHFELVASSLQEENDPNGVALWYVSRVDSPTADEIAAAYEQRSRNASAEAFALTRESPYVHLDEQFWDSVAAFEARRAQTNEWRIRLPDELIATVRASLDPKP
jgi:hypothetical protein